MAALQRFKLLATQCGVAPSPTRSPGTSPVVQLPRRKTTLRMLLGRRPSRGGDFLVQPAMPQKKKAKELVAVQAHRTLKDLFVSSPPPPEDVKVRSIGLIGSGGFGCGSDGWKTETGSSRPAWTGFRYRSLLRKAWRPILETIPEENNRATSFS